MYLWALCEGLVPSFGSHKYKRSFLVFSRSIDGFFVAMACLSFDSEFRGGYLAVAVSSRMDRVIMLEIYEMVSTVQIWCGRVDLFGVTGIENNSLNPVLKI